MSPDYASTGTSCLLPLPACVTNVLACTSSVTLEGRTFVKLTATSTSLRSGSQNVARLVGSGPLGYRMPPAWTAIVYLRCPVWPCPGTCRTSTLLHTFTACVTTQRGLLCTTFHRVLSAARPRHDEALKCHTACNA